VEIAPTKATPIVVLLPKRQHTSTKERKTILGMNHATTGLATLQR
jgi:hypothetical protein